MSSPAPHLIEMPWLPRAPEGFRDRVRAITFGDDADYGVALRALATHFLDANQAAALARAARTLRERQPSAALTPFRLGLVSNGTTDFIAPALEAAALRHGVALEVVIGGFAQIMQEALDPESPINRARPDAVLLAIDHRGLPFRPPKSSRRPPFDGDAAFEYLSAASDAFTRNCGAVCLLQTIPAPRHLLFGSLDAAERGTLRASIAQYNARIAAARPPSGDLLVDVEWLAQMIGLDDWYDDRFWYAARLPFAQRAVPVYADFVARLIGAMRGKSRKCLILDLDNTLWGGVIGDDGVDGIEVAEGNARGEAFRSLQQVALDLRHRGVVLAVCSKNDDAIARIPFRSHPGMILREDDIAVFMANWDDKATNIERIAERLDLGTDAMVLLDDNPAERALVRECMPQVAVPELGDDPTNYPRILLAAGYFETIAFTDADLARANQYKENARRIELLEGSRNLDDFLRMLEMEISFAPFDVVGRKRITQLINKTNQFNVTTRRYTEAQVVAFEQSASHYTLQVAVRDRFGDNGTIGIVICAIDQADWEIDTWLMSCRVLKRRIEEAICNRIAADARRAGAKRLIATFVPTTRNEIASNLFEHLGFTPSGGVGDTMRWVLDLERFVPFDVPLVERGVVAEAG